MFHLKHRFVQWILLAGMSLGVNSSIGLPQEQPAAQPQPAPAGPPFGRGRGRAGDAQFEADHEVFFYLLEHRDKVKRQVTKTEKGIITVTESADPAVAAKIQEHVWAMHTRIVKTQPIHMRDPLFRALFSQTKKITMKVEDTDQGVRVEETSDDPLVTKLIQAHAEVVSLFIKNGFSELPKNHAVPN